MQFFYQAGIWCYGLFIKIASIQNAKANLWVTGRKNWRENLKQNLPPSKQNKRIWIHCASLGEFEQGRPVIEAIKEQYPEIFIVLTFYSPSGYELRKDYNKADLICYLPLDTKQQANDWVNIVKPDMALFVKYEFWPNILLALQKAHIPTLFFSAIFRPSQHFFKWYGAWFRKVICKVDFLFVQNQESIQLLNTIGITQCDLAGDTRFDRVLQIATQIKPIAFVEAFVGSSLVMVAGSTWPEDEKLLAHLFARSKQKFKLIIAPHEIDNAHIEQIEKRFGEKSIRYSQANLETIKQAEVLIMDNMGMLSALYHYAHLAYIGGGFGKGIHNTLEAAVYGIPLLFGPKHHKFLEAKELIANGGAFVIENERSLFHNFDRLLGSEEGDKSGMASKKYVADNIGATEKVIDLIKQHIS